MDSFGETLKLLRKDESLSIRELGKRTGISHSYLSQIENGKRKAPTRDLIQKLSGALNVDYFYLLGKADYLKFEELSEEEKQDYLNSYNDGLKKTENSNFDFFNQSIPATIQIPVNISYSNGNGGIIHKSTSPDDVYNLFYLLNMNIDLFYKDTLLTNDDKEKIKIMLQTILE